MDCNLKKLPFYPFKKFCQRGGMEKMEWSCVCSLLFALSLLILCTQYMQQTALIQSRRYVGRHITAHTNQCDKELYCYLTSATVEEKQSLVRPTSRFCNHGNIHPGHICTGVNVQYSLQSLSHESQCSRDANCLHIESLEHAKWYSRAKKNLLLAEYHELLLIRGHATHNMWH